MSPAEDPRSRLQASEPPVVLVVEDEVIVRLSVASHLRENGFKVVEASNGAEAQALILAGLEPQVVFSDINMPNVDGVGLAIWLAENNITAPVVLTSGVAEVLRDAQRRCPNVRGLVDKPYDEDKLVAQLRALIASGA